jgi:hypothetical protein
MNKVIGGLLTRGRNTSRSIAILSVTITGDLRQLAVVFDRPIRALLDVGDDEAARYVGHPVCKLDRIAAGLAMEHVNIPLRVAVGQRFTVTSCRLSAGCWAYARGPAMSLASSSTARLIRSITAVLVREYPSKSASDV